MKKIFLILISTIIILSSFSGCSIKNTNSGDKLKIVATIFPSYDFARAVAGDNADIQMLIKPGMEVHSFEPTTSDILAIQNADIFLYIGGENDTWVKTILGSLDTSKVKILRLMDAVTLYKEDAITGSDEEVKEETGNEIEYDEHIWTSPANAIKMVNAIKDAICEKDVENKTAYENNAATYVSSIQKIQSDINEIKKPPKH